MILVSSETGKVSFAEISLFVILYGAGRAVKKVLRGIKISLQTWECKDAVEKKLKKIWESAVSMANGVARLPAWCGIGFAQ